MIEKYKGKIQGLDKDLKEILKQESEEKEVGDSQTYNKNLQGNRAISEISLNTLTQDRYFFKKRRCGIQILTSFTLYNLTLVFIFPTLFSLHSCGTDKENLFDDQELPKLVIISFILINFTSDLRVIL